MEIKKKKDNWENKKWKRSHSMEEQKNYIHWNNLGANLE